MMQKKWGTLWHPLLVPLEKTKYMVEVIARLHNYCINERLLIEADNHNLDPVLEAMLLDMVHLRKRLLALLNTRPF
jgi:hypothetical protein